MLLKKKRISTKTKYYKPKQYNLMKTNKILCMLTALLGLLMSTSCSEVADEILDLAGANKFKETDVIFQKVDGTTQRNVLSATITGNVGDKITLYIGNVNTKLPGSYQHAKWASDEPTVAFVSPATGNSTLVRLLTEGMALITATDSEGNMLTVTISCEAADGGDDDGGYDDGGDDDGGYDDGGGDDGGYDDGGGDDGGYDDGGGDDGGYDDGGGDDNGGDNGGYDDGGDPDIFDTNDAILDWDTEAVVSGTTVRGSKGGSMKVFIGDRNSKQPNYLRNITWSRSRPRVCSFGEDSGYSIKIYFDQPGECLITATDEEGNQRSFTVNVSY